MQDLCAELHDIIPNRVTVFSDLRHSHWCGCSYCIYSKNSV